MPDWSTLPRWDETRVLHLDDVHLLVAPHVWPMTVDDRDALDQHWTHALQKNPAFFNGVIHLMRGGELTPQGFTAHLFPTDFKSYLYWRDGGFRDQTVRDAFGSALIRSAEGHVLLGRQRDGNVNSGLTYLPGGFIDARDVMTDPVTGGLAIDLDRSILREIGEETGLKPHDLVMSKGYYVTFSGPQISLAREVVSTRKAHDLKGEMMSHIAADPKSELTDIVIVRTRADVEGLAMPRFAQALLAALFP